MQYDLKLKYLVNFEILISAHFAIIQSHIFYVCIAWVSFKIPTIQNIYSRRKTLRIMNFAPFNSHNTLLFKNCNILKFIDIINTESSTLVNKFFNNNSFSIFTESFK